MLVGGSPASSTYAATTRRPHACLVHRRLQHDALAFTLFSPEPPGSVAPSKLEAGRRTPLSNIDKITRYTFGGGQGEEVNGQRSSTT